MKTHKENTWVLVETVSQFRMRYMVEAPPVKTEWALDTVTCEEAKEFSQEWLGESIVSHRALTDQEAMNLCLEDNDYTQGWSDRQRFDAFFTPAPKDETSEQDSLRQRVQQIRAREDVIANPELAREVQGILDWIDREGSPVA